MACNGDTFTFTLNFRVKGETKKKKARDICEMNLDIDFERDRSIVLGHGCARVWHIVPLLGDVTSPTTAVPYESMTSELRVLSTEKHWPCAPTAHDVHKQVFTVQGEVHSSPMNK